MSPFSWQGQNLCWLSLVIIIDCRVVIDYCWVGNNFIISYNKPISHVLKIMYKIKIASVLIGATIFTAKHIRQQLRGNFPTKLQLPRMQKKLQVINCQPIDGKNEIISRWFVHSNCASSIILKQKSSAVSCNWSIKQTVLTKWFSTTAFKDGTFQPWRLPKTAISFPL